MKASRELCCSNVLENILNEDRILIFDRLKNGLIPPQYQAVFVRQIYNLKFKLLLKVLYLISQLSLNYYQKHIEF